MNRRRNIEPGLLGILRLFIGLTLVVSLIGLLVVHFWLKIPLDGLQLTALIIWALLFVYLLIPRLQRLLGRWYLSLGLLVATVMPIITQRWFQSQMLTDAQLRELLPRQRLALSTGNIALVSGDSWIITLFVPLVLIAWQYGFRHVLAFAFGTALLDLALTIPILGARGEYLIVTWTAISSRTAAFILIGFIVARLVARQRQQQDKLAEANKQLGNYASILEDFTVNLEQLTTSRERNRLARELHDTLAHTLSALSVQLEATDTLWTTRPEEAQKLLRDSLSTTRSGLTETRRALQALRASPLENLGLGLAIRQLAESAAERSGFALKLDVNPQVENLSPQVEQTIYRVVQEALENVNRHAGAKQVSVTLQRENGTVVTTVTDDGFGFDPSTLNAEDHFGLRGMQERVEVFGGSLSIQSQPGGGTTIQLTIHEAN
ncbi:MAG: sensor histidine kinase [Anaerolineae bacterium]|nr:sensor histidine kinase [Anaerolineae bacterium]